MALINCPESGRENVSDLAEMCPACGYGVKNHFARIKQELEHDQEMLNLEQRQFEEARTNELNKERYKEQRLNSVKKPDEPSLGGAIVGIIIGLIFILVGIYSVNESDYEVERSIAHGNGDPHFMGTFVIIGGIILICFAISHIYKEIQRFRLAQTNFDEYQRLVIQEQDAQIEKTKNGALSNNFALKCPVCGSHNIERLSTVNRVASIAMVGLASSKIGKQYKCKGCHHLW